MGSSSYARIQHECRLVHREFRVHEWTLRTFVNDCNRLQTHLQQVCRDLRPADRPGWLNSLRRGFELAVAALSVLRPWRELYQAHCNRLPMAHTIMQELRRGNRSEREVGHANYQRLSCGSGSRRHRAGCHGVFCGRRNSFWVPLLKKTMVLESAIKTRKRGRHFYENLPDTQVEKSASAASSENRQARRQRAIGRRGSPDCGSPRPAGCDNSKVRARKVPPGL
ncbi:MAG: hypothetical protein JWR13_3253 [Mycobacterium sp.]|nr:hypothetical protein [Mycobacterium sp.]MDT5313760.1 hypothetical protein [Mycobacterium sp.]